MSDGVSYDDILREFEAARRSGKMDPRLAAWVRFLARRAAEQDYNQLLEGDSARKKKK